jgi:hypothetical protein
VQVACSMCSQLLDSKIHLARHMDRKHSQVSQVDTMSSSKEEKVKNKLGAF